MTALHRNEHVWWVTKLPKKQSPAADKRSEALNKLVAFKAYEP